MEHTHACTVLITDFATTPISPKKISATEPQQLFYVSSGLVNMDDASPLSPGQSTTDASAVWDGDVTWGQGLRSYDPSSSP